ncbi:competence protein [Lactococcus insecticola]|uniref:Competence protein n=1 Tax=Pseudolactococcus insecticola TaxID=2709158 RepID=A0A6A0B928_9LACT|nr:competence protein [Lactococcus insecticola]
MQIRAFTLLESLLTLAVTSFLILIFSVTFQKTVHVIRGEIFVLQFENILKNQQTQAVTNAEVRSLSASDGTVFVNGAKYHVPSETLFSDFSIAFKENGNIQSIKQAKIVISLPFENDKKISYQLQLGSGQYRKTSS